MATFVAWWLSQMGHLFSKSRRNGLINAGLWVGLSNVISIAAVFMVQKVIAIQVGPAGVAIVGQYQNFLGISTSLANGGIDSGIVKYVAEYRLDVDRRALLVSNATIITLFCSSISAAVLVFFAGPFSRYLFQTEAYSYILRLFGVTVTLFAMNALLVSTLNGFGEIRKYVGSAITRTVVGLLLTVILTLIWNLTGALIALTVAQSLVFFITLLFVVRSQWFTPRFLLQRFDVTVARKLLAYSLMALTSAVLVPLVQILIRKHIMTTVSVISAGHWDAMLKISQGYLGIITGTLGVYYLPRLSSLSAHGEIRREIWSGYKIIVPMLVLSLTAIFLLRRSIVLLLFTGQFLRTVDLFPVMLIGDFLKVLSWLVAYLQLAKAKIKMFMITQVLFSASSYGLSIWLINSVGLDGAVWAHAINYGLYTLTMFYLLRGYLFERYAPA